MGINMSNNPPTSSSKDFLASPALSLSLAGIFRHGEAVIAGIEAGDEGSGGGGRRDETTVEISSENSGPTRSRSEDDLDGGHDNIDDDEDEDGGNKNKKKRKKYHRHTPEQIREMEALFKESPHPDEKQRLQLSKQLGLAPRQVKFWFQNRRTQIKAMQERHENSILKSELEKLREENKAMKETINKNCCPNCGLATTSGDANMITDEQQVRIDNARLKAEVERLRAALVKYLPGSSSPSCSTSNSQENRSSLEFYTGLFGLDKSRIMDTVNQAMEELVYVATAGEPLWIRSVETGRQILNYDEYVKAFSNESSSNSRPKRSIEASRESGVVFMDLPQLVQSVLEVNQWKEMFSCMVSRAATVEVICSGEGACKNGAIQLMFAELHMLTPMVPTREVYFVRYCKQLSAEMWALVDVSIDNVEDNVDASLVKCRILPSGCLIEDTANGHCKVTWVEHLECQKSTIHPMYRTIVNSGVAFGAKHWVATLQLQCERLAFFMATNVPTKDSTGVTTLAGRKSIMKLAQRMTGNFCQAIGASSYNTWTKVIGKTGEDVRISSRKSLNNPREPTEVIVCAVSSVMLPVSPHDLFGFLRGKACWHERDVLSGGTAAQTIAYLAKGQDRGNAVTIQEAKPDEKSMWILQDCSTNAFESMVVYAPVNINEMQSVMTGCDSSNIVVLPCGFSILPDALETRPQVISSRHEDRSTEGGSLLTIAFQIVSNSSPTRTLSVETVETLKNLISSTLQRIQTSLQCEDG